MIEEHFAQALAPITIRSVHVCRDKSTQKSLGYGYINFETFADAEKALTTMNYTKIHNVPCRLMWIHRDPSLRRSGEGNVFIQNLPDTVTSQQLFEAFREVGPILSCKVHQKKGHGFVHFKEVVDAQSAIGKWNGKSFAGKDIMVMPFVKRNEAPRTEKEIKFTNVYVKQLDLSVDASKLQKLFEQFGPITSCLVACDKTGNSKGFGFVNFLNHEDAQKALCLNQKSVEGYTSGTELLYVARHQIKTERSVELRRQLEPSTPGVVAPNVGTNLYVRNLVDSVTDEVLTNLFSPYGAVQSATVMRDSKGLSKGFGFVKFSTADECQRAIHNLNGQAFRGKPLYVAMHQKKEQRRLQLAAAYSQPRALPTPMGIYPPALWGYPLTVPSMPLPIYPPIPGWLPPPMSPVSTYRGPSQMPYIQTPVYPSPQRYPQQQHPRNPQAQMSQYYHPHPDSWAGKAAKAGKLAMDHTVRHLHGYEQSSPLQTPLQFQPVVDEKQEVGEILFHVVESLVAPGLAGRVTGMLLQSLGVPVIRALLTEEGAADLRQKIVEAHRVLQDHLSRGPPNE
ncbi:polyadenylate binding protein [Pelomyxa schiedti]|nr:polyadenylate binding protein [Pelomyxa schiedti]